MKSTNHKQARHMCYWQIAFEAFLILMLLQVVLIAFFKYKLKIAPDFIWLWKEIFIIFAFLRAGFKIVQNPKLAKKLFESKKEVAWIAAGAVVLTLRGLILSFLTGTGFGGFALFVKYDIFYLLVFLTAYAVVKINVLLNPNTYQNFWQLIKWYLLKVLPTLVWLSYLRYLLVWIKPSLLARIGYQKDLIGSAINLSQPVASHKTWITHWIVRNQFLFELPIGWWFFLAAFYPLWFSFASSKLKSLKKQATQFALWFGAVLLTFSRAALGVFLFESFILRAVKLPPKIKKKFFVIVAIIGGLAALMLAQGFLQREGSTTGHIIFTKQTFELIKQKPLIWRGPSTAWAASHKLCESKPELQVCQKIKKINELGGSPFLKGLNPENHYLQIWMELGIFGLILWLWIHWLFVKDLPLLWQKGPMVKKLVWAWSLGMAALLLGSLVLHPLSERMVAYPFMLIGGILRALASSYSKQKDK